MILALRILMVLTSYSYVHKIIPECSTEFKWTILLNKFSKILKEHNFKIITELFLFSLFLHLEQNSHISGTHPWSSKAEPHFIYHTSHPQSCSQVWVGVENLRHRFYSFLQIGYWQFWCFVAKTANIYEPIISNKIYLLNLYSIPSNCLNKSITILSSFQNFNVFLYHTQEFILPCFFFNFLHKPHIHFWFHWRKHYTVLFYTSLAT